MRMQRLPTSIDIFTTLAHNAQYQQSACDILRKSMLGKCKDQEDSTRLGSATTDGTRWDPTGPLGLNVT